MEIDRPNDRPKRTTGADFWRRGEAQIRMRDTSTETIDHIADEKRFGNGPWWFLGIGGALSWVALLSFGKLDWPSVGAGAGTMFIFITFAVERAGMSWFRKPPRR